MADFLPPVVGVLLGNITDFSAKMDEAAAKEAGVSAEMRASSKATSALFMGVGAAVLGVGVASVKMASDFQTQMTRLYTAAGAPKQAVLDSYSTVLSIANTVGETGTAMAEALYHPVSAGLDLKTSLEVVKYAAEEAQISGASLDDTTYSLSSVMKAFNLTADQSHNTMATLNAIVGEGDMRFQDFNTSIKNWAPTAAQMGISITSMGAALAYLTDRGNSAEEASTRVTMGLSMMATPSKQAASLLEGLGVASSDVSAATDAMTTVMKKTGITQNQLAQDLQSPDGIYVALHHLQTALKNAGVSGTEADSVLSKIFGGGRSDKAIMSLLQNLDGLKTKFDDITGATGNFDKALADTQQTFAFQLKQLGASAENLGIKIGLVLIPIIQSVIGWFQRNGWAADALGVIIGVTLAGAFLRFAQIATTSALKAIQSVVTALFTLGRTAKTTATETEAAAAKTKVASEASGGWAISLGKVLPIIGLAIPAIGALVDGVVKLGQKIDGMNNAWDGLDTDKLTSQLLDMANGSKTAAGGIDILAIQLAAAQSKTGMTLKGFQDLDNSLAGLISSGNAKSAAKDFAQITTALENQGYTADKVKALFPGYTKALEDAATQSKASAQASKDASGAVAGMQGPLNQTGTAADSTATAIQSVTQAFDQLTKNITASDALNGFQKDLLNVTTDIQQNGKTLDLNTLKGIANRDAFNAAAKQIADYRTAQINAGVSTEKANQDAANQATQLIKVWEQTGVNKQAVDAYATSIGLIPKDWTTTIHANTSGASQQISSLQQQINSLSGALAGMFSSVTPSRGPKAYAKGGWVDGPKGAPQLIVAHGGEFVLSDDMLSGRADSPGLGPAGLGASTGGGSSVTVVNVYPQNLVGTVTELRDQLLTANLQRGLRNGASATFPAFQH